MPSLPSPGSHFIEVNGVRQAFSLTGSGPLCIVHSGGPGIDAEYLRMPLLEARLTMVYLDPIGTGRSERLPTHPFGYSVARFADQLLGLIDALDITQAYLLGHSHGAFVVLEAALRRPEVAAGLILHAGSAYTGGDFVSAAGLRVAEFVKHHAGTPEAESVARGWTAIPAIRTDEDYTAAMRDLLPAYLADPHADSGTLAALRDRLKATVLIGDGEPFDVRDRLPLLFVPTLLAAGAGDFILGPRYSDEMAAALPRSRRVTFEHSGHFAHLEQPEGFADEVARFVEEEGRH